MLQNKFGSVLLASMIFVTAGSFLYSLRSEPAEAQSSPQYEYAVLTDVYDSFPPESLGVISSTAAVCVVKQQGCQIREFRADLNLSKFFQDEKIINDAIGRAAAADRVQQIAISRAIASLGAENWEMISSPDMRFGLVVTNPSGNQAFR
ncbi:MAG TPA: hypothetical protein VNK26_06175, partial [Pyrinomonadaceae bacterium]|nr:hypothetical protein [Pyrinomonadaceae bacterium]